MGCPSPGCQHCEKRAEVESESTRGGWNHGAVLLVAVEMSRHEPIQFYARRGIFATNTGWAKRRSIISRWYWSPTGETRHYGKRCNRFGRCPSLVANAEKWLQSPADNGMLAASVFPLLETCHETSADVEGGFGRGRGTIDLSLGLGGRR